MMQFAMMVMGCAVFAGLAALAISAALRAARVEDLIEEVFSPWMEDPVGLSPTSRDEAWAAPDPGPGPAARAPSR